MTPNDPKRVHTKKKKKDRFDAWPKRILALLVLGFCLFVGIDSSHLLTDSLKLWSPLKLDTYALTYEAIDDAYASRLFSGRPAAGTNGGGGGGDSGTGTPGPTQAGDGSEAEGETDSRKTVDDLIKEAFVDFNGLATGALGQRELNGVVKLDNGYITITLGEKQDLSYQISQTVAFRDFAESQNSKFVFVMAPHLIDKYDPMLPAGSVDYNNEMADEFLAALDAAGVATIDLREVMQEEGFDHYGGFFRTDHHWTPQTAAWASGQVLQELDEWGWLEKSGEIMGTDDFVQAHDGVRFYGTAAERTGASFAGDPDTLYCLLPKDDVQLRYKPFNETDDAYGDYVGFEELYRDWKEHADYENILGPDAYYLYRTNYNAEVLNDNAPVQSKLLLVCDSFGVPFQSFMAAQMRKVTAVQGRELPDLLMPTQENDIVMVLYTPSSLDIRTENANIFNFR